MHRPQSAALVPYERSNLVRLRGGRHAGETNVLQLASAGVVADVRIERVDRRNARSWYALKLGAGASEATARLVGRSRGGAVEELGSMLTQAGCIGTASFAVTTPRTGAYESLVLEIRSGGLLLNVDAPRPPAPRSRMLHAGAILAVAGCVILAGVLAPFVFGAGASRTGPAHEATALPSPHEAIVLPPPVTVPRAAAARVQTFSARRDQTPDGRETISASYLAVGERGTVALLDGDGTLVTTAPFTHTGTVRLPVPRAYRALPLTAKLTVRGGDSTAVSSVVVAPNALVATPAPVPSASAAAAALPGAAAQSGDTGLLLVEGRAIAGKPLHLRFAAQRSPIRIELVDDAGATIAKTEVAPGGTHAALPLPPSAERTTYRIGLYYPHGGGEELITRTVVAVPR